MSPSTTADICPGGANGCDKATQAGFTGTVCCCTGNLCNGVSTLRQQPLAIAFFVIATFAMFIYQRF